VLEMETALKEEKISNGVLSQHDRLSAKENRT